MESQIESQPVVRPIVGNAQCSFEACEDPAAFDLYSRSMCPAHFFSACTQELESWNERLRNQPFDVAAIEPFKQFVMACAEQAQELGKDKRFEDGRTKGQLLEFLLRISQLSQRLRRSPRLKSVVPVWLRREDPSRTWEEETWTTTVSRYGAGLVCHHPVQTGGTVVLCRRDRGSRVRARVVYSRFDSEGKKEIGVELLDQEDIWGFGQNAGLGRAVAESKAG